MVVTSKDRLGITLASYSKYAVQHPGSLTLLNKTENCLLSKVSVLAWPITFTGLDVHCLCNCMLGLALVTGYTK